MWDWTENQIMLTFIQHSITWTNKNRYLEKPEKSLSEKGIELLESYKMQKHYSDVEYLLDKTTQKNSIQIKAVAEIGGTI